MAIEELILIGLAGLALALTILTWYKLNKLIFKSKTNTIHLCAIMQDNAVGNAKIADGAVERGFKNNVRA